MIQFSRELHLHKFLLRDESNSKMSPVHSSLENFFHWHLGGGGWVPAAGGKFFPLFSWKKYFRIPKNGQYLADFLLLGGGGWVSETLKKFFQVPGRKKYFRHPLLHGEFFF